MDRAHGVLWRLSCVACLLGTAACAPGDAGSSDPGGSSDTGPAPDEEPPGPTTALGTGDGALDAGDVQWATILDEENRLSDPRDLGFDPDGNLWVANREDDRTFIVSDPGEPDQDVDRRKDGYAMHFMEETAAFSFEDPSGAGPYGNEFGSCGESENTYNDDFRGDMFMGPVLWSANLDVFAEQNPEGLGSHLDMNHESPNCVGIAWERDNVYWVFDGENGNVVRYDFQADHDIGQDDHSDGIIHRLSEPEVTRVRNAPGHMMIDPVTGLLFVADTGGGRVLSIDPASGEVGNRIRVTEEPVEEYAWWDGVTWSTVVEDLDRPGGLALDANWLYVAEFGSGVIHVYDRDGAEVQSLDTGWGEGAIYGIEIGPDGKLWAVDHAGVRVVRLDPT